MNKFFPTFSKTNYARNKRKKKWKTQVQRQSICKSWNACWEQKHEPKLFCVLSSFVYFFGLFIYIIFATFAQSDVECCFRLKNLHEIFKLYAQLKMYRIFMKFFFCFGVFSILGCYKPEKIVCMRMKKVFRRSYAKIMVL